MNTRTLLLLASTLVIGHATLHAEAKYSKFTADFYKGVYDQYEGQEITLKVAFIKPYSYKSDIEDVRFFHAITHDEQKKMPGGEIPVAVPITAGEELIRRFGTAPSDDGNTRLLHGILRADGHGLWFVDVNGSITKTLDAIRQTEMKGKKPSPSPSPAASPDSEASPTPAASPDHTESTNGAEPQKPWWKFW